MSNRLHTPPKIDPIGDEVPLIFLGGPIQGAPDWQAEITAALLAKNEELEVASPRRVGLDDHFVYEEQVAWEKQHLARSAKKGVIVFWFAARDFSQPYEDGRDYAKTSRVEIGRIFGWLDHIDFPVIVGIEPGFEMKSGETKLEKYLRSLPAEKGLPVYSSLEEIVKATLIAISRKS